MNATLKVSKQSLSNGTISRFISNKPYIILPGRTSILISSSDQNLSCIIARLAGRSSHSHILLRNTSATKPISFENIIANTIQRKKIKLFINLVCLDKISDSETEFDIGLSTSLDDEYSKKLFSINDLKLRFNVSEQIKAIFNWDSLDTKLIKFCAFRSNIPCIQLSIAKSRFSKNNIGKINTLVSSLIDYLKLDAFENSFCLLPQRKGPTANYYQLEIDESLAKKLDLANNSIVKCHMNGESCICVLRCINNNGAESILISNYLDRKYHPAYVIIEILNHNHCTVGVAPIERLRIDKGLYVCNTLYNQIDINRKNSYILYNKRNDAYILAGNIFSIESKYSDIVFLSKYQREILEVDIPPYSIESSEFALYLSKADNEEDIKTISESYEKKGDSYYLRNRNDFKKLHKIFYNSGIENLEIISVPQKQQKINIRKFISIIDWIVGKRPLFLKIGRVYPQDEDDDVVRISKNLFRILGIVEGDKINLLYNNHNVILRALAYSKEKEKMYIIGQMNRDVEYLVGLPARYKAKLNIICNNAIVKVERNALHIFKKRLYQYVFSVIGTLIAVLQIPISTTYRVIIGLALVISMIIIILGSERSKVK